MYEKWGVVNRPIRQHAKNAHPQECIFCTWTAHGDAQGTCVHDHAAVGWLQLLAATYKKTSKHI